MPILTSLSRTLGLTGEVHVREGRRGENRLLPRIVLPLGHDWGMEVIVRTLQPGLQWYTWRQSYDNSANIGQGRYIAVDKNSFFDGKTGLMMLR